MTLLMNYFPNYEGKISYNTIDLRELNPSSCVDLFSVIMQDPFVFYFLSIKENLLLGVRKTYSDEELYAYLEEF
jgi:ABC-type multidrug transport system fused ATPase/permease subunit